MCVFISVESEANLKLGGGTRLIKNLDKQKKKRLCITLLSFPPPPPPPGYDAYAK